MTKRLRVPVRPRRLLPTEVMTNARRARTTLSERPMVTARVKAMPPVGNGKTARPVTNAVHMATVKTRAAIRAKVIPAAMITARVMSATIAVTTARRPRPIVRRLSRLLLLRLVQAGAVRALRRSGS